MPTPSKMPPWNTGVLPDAPSWSWRNWTLLLGPGLLSAGAAIGGGEWLMGPVNTARYGGCILWVCTLSILGQVVYNIEVSRYTLYTGEPIMTGKFRCLPGPLFWLILYMILDFGSLFPYQTASTATPVASLALGRLPTKEHETMLRWLACGLYVLTAVPLVFSGKIYTFIKWMMTTKIVVVFSFLLLLSVLYSSSETWKDIATGFFKVGTVPVKGGGTENVFTALFSGRGFPKVDGQALIALAAYASIAGVGGLKNSVLSNYTRDQGWGMGAQVGAIPSIFGSRNLKLSHVGTVFTPDAESVPRWRRWVRHVTREQLAVWMTGALVGVALPAMLSVQFLPRGMEGKPWAMAGMTADGVRAFVGGGLGTFYWYMLMLCGILILVPNTTADADGTVRRWVDLGWTGSARLRAWDPRRINLLYFWALMAYVVLGVGLLLVPWSPQQILQVYTCIANFALSFSCFHTLYVNLTFLPRELRPGWVNRIALSLAGLYFFTLFSVAILAYLRWI